MQYDVIIIGGGPGGSTAAFYLAQANLKVLLLEKEKFPREHIGESLIPFCYHLFEEMGVLEMMEQSFYRKPGVTFADADSSSVSQFCFKELINDPSYLSFNVIRAKFDHILLENARKAGATILEETKVDSVDLSGGIVEVQTIAQSGEHSSFLAKFLIDASGQDTFLAKKLNVKKPFDRVHKRISFASHWRGAKFTDNLVDGSIDIVQLGDDKPGWIWMNPLAEDRLGVGMAVSMDYMKKRKRELVGKTDNWQKTFYQEELLSTPRVQHVLKEASMMMDVVVDGDSSYYAQEKFGKNFALIGDAHAFLDPIFASGIYLAMKSAEMVAKALVLQLKAGSVHALEQAFQDIMGAYAVVEELIVTFYQPGSIKFSSLSSLKEQEFKKFETVFALIHFLLAGDFFTKHERYLNAISLLKDEKMVKKYQHLIGFSGPASNSLVCN